ncbi:hypothetical protein Pyn_18395 [Prunus yedoensis var. nudiflora]|uniref:Uncharacterized protein n=1 Tax=Prunus yedoensis var. nudiflora TaxID=2094558 RepID=A0A314UM81_PRUYE|nr:hypothetical protein Pyn_18395 [Prunus yedoensis var. nudiflora]
MSLNHLLGFDQRIWSRHTLSPEEIGVIFEGGDPLLLAPDAGALGPGGLADAGVEEVALVLAVVVLEGGHVVLDIEKAAGVGSVDDLIKGVGLGVDDGSRGKVAVEGDVVGREMQWRIVEEGEGCE